MIPRRRLTVVTPAFNEAGNLPELYPRLVAAMATAGVDWEWVVVDDHSTDGTDEVLAQLTEADSRVRVIRLSRNFGSHSAIVCGLDAAQGEAAVVMAADLQNSPESITRLVDRWRAGAQVVWGVRPGDSSESERRSVLSRVFEHLVRRVVGVDALQPSNSDFVLLDRRVIDAVRNCGESRAPIFMIVTWLGFRQESVECAKFPRAHGKSGWTWVKKIELAMDSIIAFSERPLRWISALGLVTAAAGLLYALVVIANAVLGEPVAGWSSLMVVVLVVGGAQMLMVGVIGAYVWRGLDESRRRPRYVVEADSGRDGTDAALRRTDRRAS